MQQIRQNAPDQNAINLFVEQKSLLEKGPSFVPTPFDINWHEDRKDLAKFIHKVRQQAE